MYLYYETILIIFYIPPIGKKKDIKEYIVLYNMNPAAPPLLIPGEEPRGRFIYKLLI